MTLVLADTSVWASHLRYGDPGLEDLLSRKRVRMHVLVINELVMGSLPDRERTIMRLNSIHRVTAARDEEVLRLVEESPLFGTGLSWIDAHLLASALLSRRVRLWTRDKRLAAMARRYDCAAEFDH